MLLYINGSANFISQFKGGQEMVREFTDALLLNKLNLMLSEIYKPLLDKFRVDDISSME